MKTNRIIKKLCIGICITVFSISCSSSEINRTSKAQFIWEKNMSKECISNEPFDLWESSKYEVHTGINYNEIYYARTKAWSTYISSYIAKKENNAYNLEYDVQNRVKDLKTGMMYLRDGSFSRGELFELDQEKYIVKSTLAEHEVLNISNPIKIYDGQVYCLIYTESHYELVHFDYSSNTVDVLFTFENESDEVVRFESLNKIDDRLLGTFLVSKAENPHNFDVTLIQLDLSEKTELWKEVLPLSPISFNVIDDELFLFIPGSETIVKNIITGDEIKRFSILSPRKKFITMNDRYIYVREREQVGFSEHQDWIYVYDKDTETELNAIEGKYLGIIKNKVYSINRDNMVRVESVSDGGKTERIDLNEVYEGAKGCYNWKMANESNLLLGMKENCSTATLILIELPE